MPRWRSQMRQELSALHKSAPDTVADVGQAIHGVVELESALAARHDIQLLDEGTPVALYAAIHPSALRQLLITAIGQLTQRMQAGRITLQAQRQAGQVLVTIAGDAVTADTPVQQDMFQEILTAQGGTAAVHQEGERLSFQIELAPAEQVNVLVIDDNLDLVHFYRRYTAGTRYAIAHIAQGGRAFEAIRASLPHIIVLDVMLPDVDGWELLVHLHESPETRQIPIVVCSVIRERELALALGAELHLSKPVRRRQFVEALDRVLAQIQAAAPTGTANSAGFAPVSAPGPS
jgi:CheY-like chemotaxis protein